MAAPQNKNISSLGLAALVLAAAMGWIVSEPQQAGADTSITEQLETYKVTGTNLRDVNRNMFAVSPITCKRMKCAGNCHYNISWKFKYDSDSDWCRMTVVNIKVILTYTMPEWVDYGGAEADLRQKWDLYYSNLLAHEKDHGKFAIEAGRMIDGELSVLKKRSCQELKEAAEALGHGRLRELNAKNEEYDLTTKHGRLQEALLHY